MTQVYSLCQIEDLDEDEKLSKEKLQLLFRYGVEEIMRRSQGNDAQPLSRAESLALIDPEFKAFLQPIINKIKEDRVRGESGGDDPMAKYSALAAQFRAMKLSAESAAG